MQSNCSDDIYCSSFVTGYKVVVSNMNTVNTHITSQDLKRIFVHFCDKTNKDSKILGCWCDNNGNGNIVFSDEISALVAINSGINFHFSNQATFSMVNVQVRMHKKGALAFKQGVLANVIYYLPLIVPLF